MLNKKRRTQLIASQFYQLARYCRSRHLAFINKELSVIPTISIGNIKKRGKDFEVISIYESKNGNKNRMRFTTSSPKATKWLRLKERKKVLLDRKEGLEYKNILESGNQQEAINSDGKKMPRFSREYFDLLEEKCEMNIQNGYSYDGHLFRSKSELIMAQCFNELGLEYKYEVIMTLGDETFLVDFAVYCPETGQFFFVEHFGRMSDETYRNRTFHKISVYSRHNFIEGLDILYTYELTDGGFYIDVIKSKILSIIAAQLMQSIN